ncbi:MAG: magnesium transporter [Alphaproteobacteria bacterium]|nr:magnesium transporter [Alphaproteobacteria bacterium]
MVQEPEEEPFVLDEDGGDEDDAYGLTPALEKTLLETLADDRLSEIPGLVADLHPADTADLIERFDRDKRAKFISTLGDGFDPEVLAYLDDDVREEVVAGLGIEALARVVDALDSDDAIAIVEDLDDEDKKRLFALIKPEERAVLEEGLTYPESSAGRLMQRELVAVPAHWTVGQTIDFMRLSDGLPEDFYVLFIVDPHYRPVGIVALSHLLRSKRPTRIADLMEQDFVKFEVEVDQEEVAYAFQQYGLVSAPVINEAGRLVGRITVDDVVEVQAEEAEEDILRLGGVSESDLTVSITETARSRFSWLVVNLGTAIAASLVIAVFEATIEQAVALAVLMPIVASMGGNAGTQTLTVTVRALATRDLGRANMMRFIGKELAVGVFNGFAFALLTGIVAGVWFTDVMIGIIIGLAMIVNMIVAGLAGTAIPIGLDRAKIDPAVASGVFLTTVTDVVGFFAFLGLAAWLLL